MKKGALLIPEMFGENFIREVEPKFRGVRKDRQVELKCVICNKVFIVSLYNAKRIQQKSCSNKCAGDLRQKMEGGNMTHPLYARWLSMRDRCNNPNNVRYLRYGARGISYDPIFDDFSEYVNYCVNLENTPDLSKKTLLEIDRINNDKGYFKGNLRWADNSLQAANKSLEKTVKHTSKYVGICYCKTNKKWIAKVQYHKKTLHQSTHFTELAAITARQEFIIKHNLPHQFK